MGPWTSHLRRELGLRSSPRQRPLCSPDIGTSQKYHQYRHVAQRIGAFAIKWAIGFSSITQVPRYLSTTASLRTQYVGINVI